MRIRTKTKKVEVEIKIPYKAKQAYATVKTIMNEAAIFAAFFAKKNLIGYDANIAPLAQWIEHRSSEPMMWVRFLQGAQIYYFIRNRTGQKRPRY